MSSPAATTEAAGPAVEQQFTLRNRRRIVPPVGPAVPSRFNLSVQLAAPTPTWPTPRGDFRCAPAAEVLAAVSVHGGIDSPTAADKRRAGTRRLLKHLSGFPGDSWQDRWLASGLDSSQEAHRSLGTDSAQHYMLSQPRRHCSVCGS